MGRMTTSAFAAALAGATLVLAHGHVQNIVVDGVYYLNYDPTSFTYQPNGGPPVVGWRQVQPINEFVSPDHFNHSDIICHKDAKNSLGHIQVKAGSKVMFQWINTWPDTHWGPIIDALAPCNGDCESVDKTSLEFFKIAQIGLLSSAKNPGTWASDVLQSNNRTWTVQIPENIAPGNYVWRHEIIGLHAAANANGAQNYPQCFSFKITGSGTYRPKGSKVTTWFKANDPGIMYDLYSKPMVSPYAIPGPALDPSFVSSVAQASTKATATSSCTVGGDGEPSGAPTGAPAATFEVGTAVASLTAATTTAVAAKTTSASAAATAKVNVSGPTAALYAQCGGQGWTGATTCATGKCVASGQYYSQCMP